MTLLLSACSFGRVFDVTPAVDALTLAELGEALTRFQLKGDLARREERDLDRARRVARGEVDAPMQKRLERHLKRHDGEPDAAARALADLEKDIRREAKQDFRLWAPALFAPGTKREDGNVVHLSALVLDLDKGPPPESVREAFVDVWHVAHSTWSHQREQPKLRLVVPFSAPVRPEDFESIWFFADARVGHRADPTGRALARAWGLPAVPYPDRERLAWIHEAPLFDPFAQGLAASPEPTPIPSPTHHSFLRRDPGEVYLPPTTGPEPSFDPWDGGAAIRKPPAPAPTPVPAPVPVSVGPAPVPVPVPAPVPEPVPVPAVSVPKPAAVPPPTPHPAPDRIATLEAHIATLEARIAALEKVLADYL